MLCVAALNITSLIASTGLSETLLAILILYLFNGTYHLILYIQVAVANTISSFKCAAIGQSANTTSIPKDKQYATEGFLFDRSPIDVSSWIGLCTVFAFLAATGRVLYVNRLAKGDDDVLMLIAPAPAKDDSEPEDAYGFGDVCPSRAKHEHFCVSWPAVKEASWKTSSGVNIDLEAFSCPELERASSSSADSRPQAESIVYILAARCAAVLSKTAIRSRYVPGVESRMLPSLYSCSDLAKTLTAPCDDHSPRRRVFGLDLPPIRPPLAFSLEDLETDDGGYLRTALGMMDDGCEGGAAGFWPEIDQYVPRGEDGKRQAWYTDEDVMRGWHFPGREAVPEFGFHEDARSSDDSSKSELSGEWLVPDEEIIGVLIKAGVVTMGELGGGMEAEVVVEDKA